jgi:excisionase family DNA binding protein
MDAFESLWTPIDAAAYLKLHAKTVIRMARARAIPAIRLGKHWRFRASDMHAFAAAQVVESSGQPRE